MAATFVAGIICGVFADAIRAGIWHLISNRVTVREIGPAGIAPRRDVP